MHKCGCRRERIVTRQTRYIVKLRRPETLRGPLLKATCPKPDSISRVYVLIVGYIIPELFVAYFRSPEDRATTLVYWKAGGQEDDWSRGDTRHQTIGDNVPEGLRYRTGS